MKMKIAAALALFVGLGTLTASAHADPPKNDGDIEYKFKDDSLLGKDLAGDMPILGTRPPGRKQVLQRPRIQFVQELLKSVENM